MTAQTMPAQPAEDTSLRPLPWRRMAGVTWRQHRFALVGVAVLLGAVAVYLWILGSSLHNAYAAATACHPAGSPACQDTVNMQWTKYQPASRFWPFQWIEGGWLLVLSLLLLAATIWLVRRRAA